MSSSNADPTAAAFLAWSASHNCVLSPACQLTTFHEEGMGRGLIALQDIPEDELLFSVPRSLLLNLHTSSLGRWCQANESQLEEKKWDEVRVAGWAPLILSMMWEAWRCSEQGAQRWAEVKKGLNRPAGMAEGEEEQVRWGPYFDIMPTEFDSPMMWEAHELKELEGTDVLDRVGRAEADESYTSLIRPYIVSQPTIFLGLSSPAAQTLIDAEIEKYYSLAQFHLMGSRVLSRSFHVKDGNKAKAVKEGGREGDDEEEDSDDEDEDEPEDTADISMVPMADMLNARHASDNARLFSHPTHLEMRSTAPIAQGAQIFNTFGNPPNGDLLRRYGHVDEPNGADAVDLEAALVGKAVCEIVGGEAREMEERVAWLCGDSEEALLDDAFPLTYLPNFPPSSEPPYSTHPPHATPSPQDLLATLEEALDEVGSLPEELIQCARVLCLSKDEFDTHVRARGKLPGPKLKAVVPRPDLSSSGSGSGITELKISDVLARALHIRLRAYPTTLEQDEESLGSMMMDYGSAAQRRGRAALVVRMGEKRVLWDHVRAFEAVSVLVGERKRGKREEDGAGGESVSKKVRQ
ncbi:unnamed protein product [Tilletia controversa]|uniref:SET domain-containing protein n=3 Tax=Tilletia TaxID=13289 RepID=A0A8X7MYK2_9BASI|nr:hypothetical protein CF336_g2135 [Tilletia laevis]KAE8203771.1 hypothetical protein CF328_g1459 [Tilletia controversa]KAE8264456.1 hypothetical protein A4X03_0g936 [Tilletia caries]KAE8252780.1 hypothetical protein A4X06_0g1934 [Tilletia controversa]CAD6892311.1 unnamed protein product [Tilletia caries]